jgi:DNA-entry nuclease
MNATVMVKFENMVVDYIKKTNNHVLYRVTPYFEGDNLLAKGVLIEALSVEDNGEGIKFNIFIYNVQAGIIIDYSNGDSYTE